MTEKKPFLGQFAWVSGGRIVAAGLQAALLVVVAQRSTPAEFGILAAILGLATVVQTAFDFGIGTFITRERAVNPDSGAIASALRLNAITSLALTVFVFIALAGAGAVADPVYFLLLPLALSVSGERNADARLSVVFADGDAKINVFNLVARRSSAIVIFLVLSAFEIDPLLSYSVGVAVAAVGSSLFANLYVSRRVVTAPSMRYRDLIRASWPYWLNSMATQARNLDVVVTAALAGATQAGYYSTGSRLTSPLRILPTSLASVLLPAASRASAKAASLRPLMIVAGIVLAGMTVIYGLLFLVIPWLIPTLLGSAYVGAVPAVQIVVAGLPLAAAASLAGSLLQGQGEKHFVATAATITTIACLVMVVIAVPFWQAVGAALALSASFFVQTVLLIARLARVSRNRNR